MDIYNYLLSKDFDKIFAESTVKLIEDYQTVLEKPLTADELCKEMLRRYQIALDERIEEARVWLEQEPEIAEHCMQLLAKDK